MSSVHLCDQLLTGYSFRWILGAAFGLIGVYVLSSTQPEYIARPMDLWLYRGRSVVTFSFAVTAVSFGPKIPLKAASMGS